MYWSLLYIKGKKCAIIIELYFNARGQNVGQFVINLLTTIHLLKIAVHKFLNIAIVVTAAVISLIQLILNIGLLPGYWQTTPKKNMGKLQLAI